MKKKRLSFIRAFFAILFGIPLLACVIVLIVTMRLDSLFQPKELAAAVMENLDASTLKASDLIGDADEGQSLASYISDQIANATGDEIQISDSDLEKILSDKSVRAFLSDKLEGYTWRTSFGASITRTSRWASSMWSSWTRSVR